MALDTPRKCPSCQCVWQPVASGFIWKQRPYWQSKDDVLPFPEELCFNCSPPDFGGISATRLTESDKLDQQDEAWDRYIREIEEQEWRSGLYNDPVSPRERRER